MNSEIHLAHILVQYEHEADDLLRKIAEGESFATLASKYSLCPSGKSGGDLGRVAMNRLDPDFAEAAQKLEANQISPVVRTRFGYHLIQRF